MEERKNKNGFIIIIVLLLLIIIGLIFYIFLNNEKITASKKQNNSELKQEISEEQEDKEDTTIDSSDNNTTDNSGNQVCTGIYYGEAQGTLANGLSYDYKYKYILNSDGTFTASFGDVSSTSGVYVINDNTISLISKKESTGPREQDPYYSTTDYVIADDCSYIIYNSDSISFKLNKQ